MRLYIYSLLNFPSNIDLHVYPTNSISNTLLKISSELKDSRITRLLDSEGNILETLAKVRHGNVYFVYNDSEIPIQFHTYVKKALSERLEIVNDNETFLEVLALTIQGVISFFFSWMLTGGGIPFAIPICLYLTYACFKKSDETFLLAIKYNIFRIIRTEKKFIYAFLSWITFDTFSGPMLLTITNDSVSTPPRLVTFSICFIIFFVMPQIMKSIKAFFTKKSCLMKFCSSNSKFEFGFFILVLLSIYISLILDPYLMSIVLTVINKDRCLLLFEFFSPSINAGFTSIKNASSFIHSFNNHGIFEGFIDFASDLGEVPKILPPFIVLALYSQLIVPKKYELIRNIFTRCVLVQIIGGAVSAGLKMCFHRYRPLTYGDPMKFTGPGFQIVDNGSFSNIDLSFPCGHATVTFGTAFVIYKGIFVFLKTNRPNFNPKWWIKFSIASFILIFPFFTGISRISGCKHWASDVYCGLLLGYFIANILMNKNIDLEQQEQDEKTIIIIESKEN